MTENTVDQQLLTRSQLAPEQNTNSDTPDSCNTVETQRALYGAPLAPQATELPHFPHNFPQVPFSNIAAPYNHVAVAARDNPVADYTFGSLQGPSMAHNFRPLEYHNLPQQGFAPIHNAASNQFRPIQLDPMPGRILGELPEAFNYNLYLDDAYFQPPSNQLPQQVVFENIYLDPSTQIPQSGDEMSSLNFNQLSSRHCYSNEAGESSFSAGFPCLDYPRQARDAQMVSFQPDPSSDMEINLFSQTANSTLSGLSFPDSEACWSQSPDNLPFSATRALDTPSMADSNVSNQFDFWDMSVEGHASMGADNGSSEIPATSSYAGNVSSSTAYVGSYQQDHYTHAGNDSQSLLTSNWSSTARESSVSDMPQHQDGLENPARAIDFLDDAAHQVEEAVPSRSVTRDKAIKAFGPSRQISLPPARRGGRRGPLSAQQAKQRKHRRKQGVCIRCRWTKTGCDDGVPCSACRENSKATLWIYPCVKAHFMDIIECGSFFTGVSAFENGLRDKRNVGDLASQFAVIAVMAQRDARNIVTLGSPVLIGLSGLMSWRIIAQIMGNLVEECRLEKSIWTTRRIAEAPRKRELKGALPPLLFRVPGSPESRINWLVRHSLLCMMPHSYEPLHGEDLTCLSEAGLVNIHKSILETFITVDRLYSMSGVDCLEAAEELLQVLELSSLDFVDNLEKSLLNTSDEECQHRKEREGDMYFETMEVLRNSLASLETFDTQLESQAMEFKNRVESWMERHRPTSKEEEQTNAESITHDDLAAVAALIQEIATGDLRPEVEEIVDTLKDYYEPKLYEITPGFAILCDILPSLSEDLTQLEELKAGAERIRTGLEEILGKETTIRDANAEYHNVKRRIAEATGFMEQMDELIEVLAELGRKILQSERTEEQASNSEDSSSALHE